MAIVPDLKDHLRRFVADDPQALVFSGPSEGHPPLRRNNFRRLVGWAEAVAKVGAPGLHVHDLRHTGNTESARTGASTRDLMVRMGHDSPRAALKYQHATAQADRAIADALSDAVRALGRAAGESSPTSDSREHKGKDDDEGTSGVLVPVS
jgi:integrase